MTDSLDILAARLGELLRQRGLTLATAESCTGGWIAKTATDIAGSSDWLDCGFVTYSNGAKQAMLGVRAETLAAHGAVSEATVLEMAAGAIARSSAQAAVATSGIAGPGGGSADKPVGTVWLAWSLPDRPPWAERHRFDGDRDSVRRQSVHCALAGLIRALAHPADDRV